MSDPSSPAAASSEPVDPNALPVMQFEGFRARPGDDDSDADSDDADGEFGEDVFDDEEDDSRSLRPVHLWWFVAAVVVLVAAGGIIGVRVFNSSAPTPPRGAVSAVGAATVFTGALNAADPGSAADVSCTSFANDARSAARSAKDPSIRYQLKSVQNDPGTTAKDSKSATAVLVETMHIADTTQHSTVRLSIELHSGRWLVCGRS